SASSCCSTVSPSPNGCNTAGAGDGPTTYEANAPTSPSASSPRACSRGRSSPTSSSTEPPRESERSAPAVHLAGQHFVARLTAPDGYTVQRSCSDLGPHTK